MSHTIRRRHVHVSFNLMYLIPDNLMWKDVPELEKIADNLFRSDRTEGHSAPKWLRQDINRSERYHSKNNIRTAIMSNSLDNFINSKLYLPYFN